MDVTIKLKDKQYTSTSAAQAMYAMLQYTDLKDMSLAEVMGYTTHAFRINIHEESVSPAGPTMFDPYELVSLGFETLGVATITYNHPAPLPDESIANVVRFIQSRIDKGVPTVTWDIFAPEFGLFYGYDHDKQVLFAKDIEKDGTVKYSELNERRFNHIFVCGFQELLPTSQTMMLKNALKRILEHADGKSFYAYSHEYKHGLAGYEAWINAFEGKRIDPFGNAYNTMVVADARIYAHQFFIELQNKWNNQSELDQQVIQLFKECEQIYGMIAQQLANLKELFPFPQGGEPNDPINSERAIQILKTCHEWESQGVKLLRDLYELVSQYEDDKYMFPRLWNKSFQFVGEKHEVKVENVEVELPLKLKGFLKRANKIRTRFIATEIIARKPAISIGEEVGSYIVACPVSMKPVDIPHGMNYFEETNQYAFIRAKKENQIEADQLLKKWIVENNYSINEDAYSIEYTRNSHEPGMFDEVEIYIPIK